MKYKVKAWADGMGWCGVRTDQVGGSESGEYEFLGEASAAALRLRNRDASWMSCTPMENRRVAVFEGDRMVWQAGKPSETAVRS